MKMPPKEELLSTAELAAFYSVSEQTVRLWRKKGQITPAIVSPSGRPYYHKPQLGEEDKV